MSLFGSKNKEGGYVCGFCGLVSEKDLGEDEKGEGLKLRLFFFKIQLS